jgi:hypothetical protein
MDPDQQVMDHIKLEIAGCGPCDAEMREERLARCFEDLQ